MKILRIAVEGLPLFQERLDICFYAQQRVSEEQRALLYPLFSKVFLNTTNVFAGINASGKTSTLKVILFALHLLSGKSINSISVNSLLGRINEVSFRIYFYSEKTAEICKLETVISFKDIDSEGQPVYIISSEKLWCKKASSVTSRTRMLDFDETKPLLDRNDPNKKELLSFLADDSSIIIAKNKKDDDAPHFVNLLTLTNSYVYGLNVLELLPSLLELVPEEVISFLDPSIEYLNFERDKQHSIHLKFKGKDELVLINCLGLTNTNSSFPLNFK